MRDFDNLCLIDVLDIEATQIKEIRERNHVSQPVFARYLNTSKSTVQKWEIGAKWPSGMAQWHGLVAWPSGMALKLLSVV